MMTASFRRAAGLPLFCLGLALAGCATEPTIGPDARQWLSLQRGGAAASAAPPAMSGEVADKVHQRYVDSFGNPLPEQFGREDFAGGGEGSGGGR
jgi:hypothetical protein